VRKWFSDNTHGYADVIMSLFCVFVFISTVTAMSPTYVLAHGGGLDGQGCHRNKKQGGYHCHRGQLAGQEFSSKGEVLNKLKTSKTQPAGPITGTARIVDGDTIWIGNTKIRLHGIDAPETKQMCKDAKGNPWMAGQAATAFLEKMIEGKEVYCLSHGKDRYKRVIGSCEVGGVDINREMVIAGLARAYRQYSKRYLYEEHSAMRNKAGIWGGECEAPWEWRKR
jgi:endonuclease YncB( thermonuclease family)